MSSISAIIIAKNEERMIGACLDSLTFCNEMLVVDNESSDKTAEIAKKKGARVVSHKMRDFSQARDFGLAHAKSAWILYVDADERVTEPLRNSIKYQVLSIKYDDMGAFRIKRKNYYFGNHEWPYVERLERLFKKDKLKGWHGKLHESPEVDGRVGELDGFLLHYTHRNLSEMVEKTLEWSKIEAQLRYDAGHPRVTWWRFPRVMLSAFYNSYITQSGWKAGMVGIVESTYQAFSMFVTYARLWEMQKKVKSEKFKVKTKN